MLFESDSSEEDEEITTTTLTTTKTPTLTTIQQQHDVDHNNNNNIIYESTDLLIAKNDLIKNPYDKNAWLLLLQEIDKSNNKIKIMEIYQNMIIKFPRSYILVTRYVDILIFYHEYQQAEEIVKKYIIKCRSVDLWISYLHLIKLINDQKSVNNDKNDQYNNMNMKKIYENIYEKALDNIGYSINVHIIWRKYIDFVLNWSIDMKDHNIDSGRQLTVLRDLYQRAICTPMDGLDSFWREYEEWEMKAGKHLAEQLLPEFKRKYIDAKNIYKERKKLYSSIDLGYIACPPSVDTTLIEVKQLEQWNQLIKFEVKNPYDYTDEQLKSCLDMIFDRFISCFYHHPEAWIMFSKYQHHFKGIEDAVNTLKEGIVVIPDVPTLWLELAELEETSGEIDNAQETLRSCFEQIPSSFTFSILQKFIRRKEGKVSARKLFSDTIILREKGVLGLETYVSHASLELEVNKEPNVALKVLELAKEHDPTAYTNILYIKVLTKVLTDLGDFRQLRWVYEAHVGSVEGDETKSNYEHQFKPEEELHLWEDLLEAELKMSMCDTKRLRQLQDKVKQKRAQCNKVSIVPSVGKIDLFEPIEKLHERFVNMFIV